MSENERDPALDALLADALALKQRAPDPGFVARVDAAVAESERYRRWRRTLWSRFMSEMLAVGAIAGSVAVLSRAPGVRDVLSDAPDLLWPALLGLLLIWTLLMRGRSGLFA